jgi:hypothetical protein
LAIDDAAIDPEQATLRGAESRLLANAIAKPPLVYREELILRELEELSYKASGLRGLPYRPGLPPRVIKRHNRNHGEGEWEHL